MRYILDTVIGALAINPERKFTYASILNQKFNRYVEQGFFQRWWREQDEPMKRLVHKLVENGQV